MNFSLTLVLMAGALLFAEQSTHSARDAYERCSVLESMKRFDEATKECKKGLSYANEGDDYFDKLKSKLASLQGGNRKPEPAAVSPKKDRRRLVKEAYTQCRLMESMQRLEEAKRYCKEGLRYAKKGDEYYDKLTSKLHSLERQ